MRRYVEAMIGHRRVLLAQHVRDDRVWREPGLLGWLRAGRVRWALLGWLELML